MRVPKKWTWIFLIVGVVAVLGFYELSPVLLPTTYTYQGSVLPRRALLEESTGPFLPPPPAWMLVNGKAIQATYGSFCSRGKRFIAPAGCSDMIEPWRMRLATVQFPLDSDLTILIGAQTVRTPLIQLRTLDNRPSQNFIGDWTRVEQDLMRFSAMLDPISGDQVLWVHVIFTESEDATYLWRITPPTHPLTRVRPTPSTGYPHPYP